MSNFLEDSVTVEDFVREGSELSFHGDGEVQEEEEDSFPEIDLSLPDAELVEAVREACASWGFFRATQHGIPQASIEKVCSHSLRFFGLPLPDKLRALNPAHLPRGYISSSFNAPIKCWNEALPLMPGFDNILDLLRLAWPCAGEQDEEELRSVSADLNAYTNLVGTLAERILAILCRGLNINPREVTKLFDSQESVLRLNYYPPCPIANSTLGLPPHADFGGLTLLYQDNVGGLEVLKDGKWVLVKPKQACLIVNVGDIIQVLSNKIYKSALHRCRVHSSTPRLSLAFFLNPATDAMLAPISQLVTDKHPPKYRPFSMDEYRATFGTARARGNSPTLFFEVPSMPI